MDFLGNIQDMVGPAKLEQQKLYLMEGKGKPALSVRRGAKEVYVPYPKQILFHKTHEYAWETLYGGAAGGGKSFSMLWDAYMFCIKNPGIRTILFRRTYPQLEKSLIFYSRMIFDSSMGKYNTRDKTWTIYTGGKPSYITFGHCQNESDVYGYQSAQYDAMYFDELTHWTEFQYTYLLTRLRPNVPGVRTYVKSASNPGGIGHAWVRRRFRLWDKTIQFQVYQPDMGADESVRVPSRCFVPAYVQDNLYIMKNDPGYVDRLKASPYAKQLLEGDWGIFSGQAFPEFDTLKHTMQSFPIPANWERWTSMDYGYARPFSCHWHARDPETGRIYTYREIYGAGIKEMDQAKKVVAASMVEGQPERIFYHCSDPSVFTPRGQGSSIADVWGKNGLTVVRGNRDRLSGKARIHDYLSLDREGKPFWIIFVDKCPNLVRTLPELVLDEKNTEDVDCFVKGTPVSTVEGTKLVEDVEVGDMLNTPIGPREVVRAGISGESDRVCTAVMSDGRELRGTANHEIAVYGKGLTKLKDLEVGDEPMGRWAVLPERLWKTKKSFIMVSNTLGGKAESIMSRMAHIWREATLRCTDRFILIATGLFPWATTCTTKTTTTPTIPQRILLSCLRMTMRFIMGIQRRQNLREIDINGIVHPRGKRSWLRTPPKCGPTLPQEDFHVEIVALMLRLNSLRNAYARTVKNFRDSLSGLALFAGFDFPRKSSEIEPRKPVHIVAVGNFGSEKVYRLTVAESHLYYANGILVTNTRQEDHAYDDCRYFFMSIQAPKRFGSSEIDDGYIDEGSRKEWAWFKKQCIDKSAGDFKALGSEINDVRI